MRRRYRRLANGMQSFSSMNASHHASFGVPGNERGWLAHSDGIRHRDAINDRESFRPVEPGRLVGLGAICDLRPQRADERSQSFSVSEFVTFEDGRRVTLHEARGFTIGWGHSGESGSPHATVENLTQSVLTTVLPDDDQSGEQHPWSWLADLARARGLNVTAEDLRSLPYEVILTEKVRRWLTPT
jgi:hypothetical protein